MRTGSLIILLVRICLCVSISGGEPSVYFLLNIGYVADVVYRVYVVYVVYVVVVYVVYDTYTPYLHNPHFGYRSCDVLFPHHAFE